MSSHRSRAQFLTAQSGLRRFLGGRASARPVSSYHSLRQGAKRVACGSLAVALLCLTSIPSAIAQTAPPDSLLKNWSAGPSWFEFFKVIFFLALVLGLIWVTLTALKKTTRKSGFGLGGVEVVGGLPLGPRRSLIFVKIGSAIHVIGATDHHLSSIAVITDPDEIAAITTGNFNANQPSFSAILRKFTGQPPATESGAPHV